MENCNPGGTGKDRAALSMLQTAEHEGYLPPPLFQQQPQQPQGDHDHHHHDDNSSTHPNNNRHRTTTRNEHEHERNHDTTTTTPSHDYPEEHSIIHQAIRKSKTGGIVFEGTSGSTGISLAQLCRSRGHACVVVMPDDQALEKQHILKTLGALVHVVPNVAISNPHHYVNVAKRMAAHCNTTNSSSSSSSSFWNTTTNCQCQALFVNQFENRANYHIHYTTTGPEIWKDVMTYHHNHNSNTSTTTTKMIDAFCMSSGTGGTIAGVSHYLKEQDPNIQIVLVDPPGSALYHKVTHGVAYAPQQRERGMKRHRYDTLAEGIGLDRVTSNFAQAIIDTALQVSDQDAVDMAHYLLELEGLWMGSSSAMNLVGAVQTALSMPPHSQVVTVMCDGGQRHLTRFWNRDFIVHEWGLQWPGDDTDDDDNDNDDDDTDDDTNKDQGDWNTAATPHKSRTTTTNRRRIPACLQELPNKEG
eukprot:CAMPEP_0195285658 /NCGR_PEP_ID=MMETSP0707-20130614/3410_1 /TAXON_ID=33640 /ORGANISM="Asterionellopsis glacialis, Strain CCMP134" /LENGTH=470 /DNA_ID=CAMNT_0040345183 /DNA_START=396 /DNA_END=1808 /DNA_ORIENTATION=-